jgi:hypothetical protein
MKLKDANGNEVKIGFFVRKLPGIRVAIYVTDDKATILNETPNRMDKQYN